MGVEPCRIGLLWPADGRNDKEFWRWLPTDVELLIARYDVGGTLDLEQLEADAEVGGILGAAHLLRHAEPQVLTLGDCAGSFVGGRAGNEEQSWAVTDATGVHAITMSTAFVSALEHLRNCRIAVLSPYAPDVTGRFCTFLSEHGIEIVSNRSIDRASERDIDVMTARDWMREAQQATDAEAEALIVAGGGVSLYETMAELEQELGRPVITGPGALMWTALRHIGIDTALAGAGTLYETKR